jgi:hypothetical protein
VRQGDVLVLPVIAIPTRAKPVEPENNRLVLAHGEATGHHHSFAFSDQVALFREDGSGGGLFLLVNGASPAQLEHQEHSTLEVATGPNRVLRQRTYQAGMARRVVD